MVLCRLHGCEGCAVVGCENRAAAAQDPPLLLLLLTQPLLSDRRLMAETTAAGLPGWGSCQLLGRQAHAAPPLQQVS